MNFFFLNRNNLDYANLIKLLEKQENKRFSDLRKNFEDNINLTPKNKMKKIKLHKDLQEYQDLFPVKKALSYLSTADLPLKLLTICKSWRFFLRNKISKMYLIKFSNEKLLKDLRIQMWLSFFIPEVKNKKIINNNLIKKRIK